MESNNKFTLLLGDCLERMKEIESGSVDAIICDPPYQVTACKWDLIIPLTWHIVENGKLLYLADALIKGFSIAHFEENKIPGMWEQLKRIIKPNGAIVMTASQPFTSILIMSNVKNYKHQWVWNKNNSAGFATAKIRPFSICEDILVFSGNGEKVNYYPQMTKGKMRKKGGYSASDNYGIKPTVSYNDDYYPKNLINISNASQKGKLHPTAKPVALMEYLIKTYTNEGETVLDFACGSGTTLVACKNTGRRGIGIELDEAYFNISEKRINGE